MKQWIYLALPLEDKLCMKEADILGKAGWELVSTFDDHGFAILYFKRELAAQAS